MIFNRMSNLFGSLFEDSYDVALHILDVILFEIKMPEANTFFAVFLSHLIQSF